MVSIFKFKNKLFSLFVFMFLIFGLSVISGSEQNESSKTSAIVPDSGNIPKSLLPQIVTTLGSANSRYHISEEKGGYTSNTPGHGIVTTFSKDQVKFERGENVIGMSMVSNNRNIEPVKVLDNKIEYQRGNITEWYVNSPYGIEQGFTVNKKPQRMGNEVSVRIGLDLVDGVKAVDLENGKSIRFVDSEDNHILNYSGLYAFDSRGKELPSSLSLKENDIIQINVDDQDAQYPITIDPFVETQIITAADPTNGSGDDFGLSVSIDGNRAIVGIPGWDDAAGSGQGAAIIYEFNTVIGVWLEVQTLLSPSANSGDDFGTAVAISGDWALVGEPDGDEGTIGDGSAHFFERTAGGTWTFRQSVFHSPGSEAEFFGSSVSISGDRAVVGDPGWETATTSRDTGRIFIYERNAGNIWIANSGNPIATMDSDPNDEFGQSVSISGDWLMVGAPGDSNNGGFSDFIQWGAIYFFQRDGLGNWTEMQKVTGDSDNTLFGTSVSISGDRAVGGAPGQNVPGSGSNTGAAYVFERSGTTWGTGGIDTTTEIQLLASDFRASDRFAQSVSIDGDYILIGTPGQDVNNPGDPGFIRDVGSVYVYNRDDVSGMWGDEEQVMASDASNSADFGTSVFISGQTLMVGAPDAPFINPLTVSVTQGQAYFYELGGMLTIVKESDPDAVTGFGFTGIGFPPSCGLDGSFTLDDNDSAGISFIACDLVPGSYTVQETDPNGFTLVDLSCVGTTDFTEIADGVTVNLIEDDMVVCTFTNLVNNTLTASVVGGGTITSAPAGIDCGADCTEDYVFGTAVTLTATPDVGFVFSGWSGAQDCRDGSVTMNRDRNCIATFIAEQFTLDVTVNGAGTVTSVPAGIDCGSDCTEDYDFGTDVVLTPTPDAGFMFDSWTGTGCTTGTVAMSEDRSCTANFVVEQFTLDVTVNGTGTVTSAPAGIDCGADCTEDYDSGTDVVLTPTPGTGFVFDSWTGTGCTTGTVAMSEDRSCTANFVVEQFTLDVTVNGTGTVTSAPAGIDCGADCTEDYDSGTDVVLTPTPGTGFVFDSWTGTGCTTGTVAMSEDRSCTANFVVEQFTLDLTVNGTGTVTSAPAGINCGADCTEDYDTGTSVVLTPTPGTGFVFDSWTGTGCTTGTVAMSEDRSCTANFVVEQFTLDVTVNGTGTVTSAPAGINCGADCTEDYDTGTSVVLTPTPGTGFVFDSWTGTGCTTGTVAMSEDRSCTANFVVEQFTLDVTVNGTGTVTSAPAGIDCGADCTEDYDSGTDVVLTPTPGTGFVFDSWTGTGCTTGTVAMSEDRSCTANFVVEQFTLDVTVNGTGTVTSAPAGINCGADCTEDYDTGTSVVLTPTPGTGFVFDSWTGTGCTTGTVAMSEDRSCTANFVVEQFTLNTSVTGGGTIAATGIACPGDCTEDFDTGTVVALTPTADAGFMFDSWTGTGCTTGTVTMSEDRSCTANFVVEQFTLNTSVTGGGTIAATGIACPGDCTEDFDTGTVVALTPTADAGFMFDSWTGTGCTTGTVTMSEDRSCTANFVVEQFTLNTSVTGGGTIAATGIACPGDCTEDFDTGTVVALTPTADAGFMFDSWTGTGCTTGTVTMSEDRSCTANFVVEQFTLNTSVTGGGTIAATGIACPGDCTEDFDTGTVVALTPTADAGFVFDGWTGDADCSDGSVTMNTDRSCTANFILNVFDLSINLAGAGIGNVSAAGIDCGDGGVDCTESYTFGTVVNLTTLADLTSIFTGFTGHPDCIDGSVTIDANKTCIATFDVSIQPLILNPIFPALSNNVNVITAEGANPNDRVAFVWGFQAGTTVVGGNVCNGLELGIKNIRLLGLGTTSSDQVAELVFFIPQLGDTSISILTQAVNLANCNSSEVVETITRTE